MADRDGHRDLQPLANITVPGGVPTFGAAIGPAIGRDPANVTLQDVEGEPEQETVADEPYDEEEQDEAMENTENDEIVDENVEVPDNTQEANNEDDENGMNIAVIISVAAVAVCGIAVAVVIFLKKK